MASRCLSIEIGFQTEGIMHLQLILARSQSYFPLVGLQSCAVCFCYGSDQGYTYIRFTDKTSPDGHTVQNIKVYENMLRGRS